MEAWNTEALSLSYQCVDRQRHYQEKQEFVPPRPCEKKVSPPKEKYQERIL